MQIPTSVSQTGYALVVDRVMKVVRDVFPDGEATHHSSLEDVVGWDSLQHLSLILALEEEFNVSLTPKDIESMQTVQDIVAILSR